MRSAILESAVPLTLWLFVYLPLSSSHLVKRQTAEKECECVPYFQCEDGKIVSTGEGLLDIRDQLRRDAVSVAWFSGCFSCGSERHGIKTCSGIEVCCMPPDDAEGGVQLPVVEPSQEPVTDTPIEPNPSVDPAPVSEEPIKINYVLPQVTSGKGCGRRRLPASSNPLGDDSFRITGYAGYPEETFYGEVPWVVRLLSISENSEDIQCGGSLITPTVVLTAAHCVPDGNVANLFIRVGEWNTRSTEEPIAHQDKKVSKVILHPEFNSKNLANDIALLGLDSPVTLSETVDVVCTPDTDNPVNGTACVAVGWGKNDMTRQASFQETLRKVHLPLISREECQKRMRTTKLGKYFRLLPGFICAGGEPERDTCKGDGGGPLYCPLRADSNRFAQVGVISWGIDCGKGNPAVFSSVEHYMDWIKEQIG